MDILIITISGMIIAFVTGIAIYTIQGIKNSQIKRYKTLEEYEAFMEKEEKEEKKIAAAKRKKKKEKEAKKKKK